MKVYPEGPCGRLEALYERPDEDLGRASQDARKAARAAAIVCHPHPVHGGTLRNTVVFRTARALRRAGLSTLRFNFRGVGESDGEPQEEGGEADARAALEWLAGEEPEAALWAAGFSYGARAALALAAAEPRVRRVVCVALPTRVYGAPGVARLRQPGFFLFAGDDEFGNLSDFRRHVKPLPAHFETQEIAGTDHFFRRATPALEAAVHDYAHRSLHADL